MAWQGILGHDELVERFRRSLAAGRMASTFLFVGPAGVGKRTFALKLAQALLCQARPAEALDPCGVCPSCAQVAAGMHPDLMLIAKPADKSAIPLALLIGDEGRRMREGLCHDIALKPFMGGRKVAIINDADALNEEGANCLLKTLEEPPPRSVLILIGTSAERQLPTIRSRAQLIRFAPLSTAEVRDLLLAKELAPNAAEAERIAQYSEGSLERAAELADGELWEFRRKLLLDLAARPMGAVALGKAIGAFVDEAGKEAPVRGARARQVVTFAADLYRQLLRRAAGLPVSGDVQLEQAVEKILARGETDIEVATRLADRTLVTLTHIDRNANQGALIEGWIDELAQIAARRPVEPLPLG